MKPKYRIIQRGNERYYAQRRVFGFFYTDITGSGSRYQTDPMRDIERLREDEERIKNYKTIKKVIPV